MLHVRFATVVGNPKAGSRTLTAASALTGALADRFRSSGDAPLIHPVVTEPIDLARLADGLLVPWQLSPDAHAANESAKSAGLLIIATPTYRASYSGLLKLFLDTFPAGSLTRTVVVPLTVAGGPAHRHLADLQLRPVLSELGAVLPAPTLLLEERELTDLDAVVEAHVAQYTPILTANVVALSRSAGRG